MAGTCPYNAPLSANVAQPVEQRIRNAWVGGSIPPIGSNFLSLPAPTGTLAHHFSKSDRVRQPASFF